eukprot:CAMPEP_0119562942 /NCGR_PEP_ID=MMETSP1352-20130426/22026_1 /TAXON_ID=265584 /ORGANISM="Stauroneis constricta, Strain CCMP1120" /LENGTH=322 /DNA_ID=CAMNT_0007611461 /DNA_START=309 /DNA_END=1277 /DNA_ORIENTATION=+
MASNDRTFYEWNAIRLIFPWVSAVLAAQCATLAWDSVDNQIVNEAWAIVIYMVQATVAPGLFLVTFVSTYIAHRTRSIPFCLVYRGSGKPEQGDEEPIQRLVRPPTIIALNRLFAVALLVVSFIINFDEIYKDRLELTGRTGWYTVVADAWSGESYGVTLSLMPMALVSILCMYFAMLLWRYGTVFSMTIYPSMINPWLFPVIGVSLLFAGQCVGRRLFPILSNAGIFMYILCLFRVLVEIQRDVNSAHDLGNFLDALGDENAIGSVVNERTGSGDKDILELTSSRFQLQDTIDEEAPSSGRRISTRRSANGDSTQSIRSLQ